MALLHLFLGHEVDNKRSIDSKRPASTVLPQVMKE